jgi:molecular chaperone GrpE (heat shock protein)
MPDEDSQWSSSQRTDQQRTDSQRTDSQRTDAQRTERRLDELTDLFRRRLIDDREKQRAFDALYRELAQARAVADGQYLVPLVRRLINVMDRLAADAGELAGSVVAELTDILAMYEVEEIKPGSELFDPRNQEVATVVDAADAEEDGTVATVRRSGWRLGGRVLRPTLVDVRRLPDPGLLI